MSVYQSILERKELSALALLSDTSVIELAPFSRCRLLRVPLLEGVELAVWRGNFAEPVTMNVRDDSERIHFSYSLRGHFQSWFDDGDPDHVHTVHEGGGCINYNPGRAGGFRQYGDFESVIVMIRPDSLYQWVGEPDVMLQRLFDSGRCFAHCLRCNAELKATAQALSKALRVADLCPDDGSNRGPLWLFGTSLVFVGLLLESLDPGSHCACDLSIPDREKLLRARDFLLANLSQAPTIEELARASDLSVIKLKRGFRQLFNSSVYGLFQRERMHEARRRLGSGGQSVLQVAAELGYTNASHFAAAFHKEFGVKPSALKRR
ncbi:AraC family transcriptional regulator [Alloalcanivorax dieselolei]|nr:AraC family transcriptional regulator [Alloalcanivorax dieselolei]GGJ97748.1 AraC family transcriptional regulator [Alloalcanivorax dieselolei]